ncbi:DUF4180 domain-containing protein [Paenibacillus polymyxa]|uniref:DUF4180 domain-containing protein n=1 Tax=Paenibacillus polymyxa TaxID=1406 RepID=UPI0028891CC2|nr:DUF4180 domain-containing protein [Paenibacillus polymyxa]
MANIESDEIIINNVQDALDLMASVRYADDADKLIIDKSNITEEFFELKTKLAGEILQKYVNYQVKLSVVGDFDVYDSNSLRDFICECNNGEYFFFLKTKEEALQKLHNIS